ncbi:MAG: hypothetical protein DI568_02755 [Sphingomonas sp.]|nr:MAG: hypothetical protein DI568_02755 [Sphingomonas sp.]
MPKHRKEVALNVARSLYASEDAIDSALTQVANFVAMMPAARQEAKFAACVGQDALAQAINAMTMLNQAREAMVRAHDALAEVRDQFHIGPLGYGVDPYKPAYPNQAQLRPVQAA